MKKIAVIVPCFNEETRLKDMEFKDFLKKNPSYHFFFVDDGSTDNTFESLSKSFDNYTNTTVIQIGKNRGKGRAIQFAVNNIDLIDYDYFAFIDADLEIPLHQLNNLFNTINFSSDFNTVLSYRVSSKILSNRVARRSGSVLIRNMASYLIKFEKPLIDTQCGCKMFSKGMLDVFQKPFISSWLFDIEIILRIRNYGDFNGSTIGQVALESLNEVSGKKNFNMKTIYLLLKELHQINKCYN